MTLIPVPLPVPLFRFLVTRLGWHDHDAPVTIEIQGVQYKLKAGTRRKKAQ